MPSLLENPIRTNAESGKLPGNLDPPLATNGSNGSSATLIDQFLARQSRLTAVELFSQRHDEHALPRQAKYYRDLIPADKPGRDEQYAFVVDLDKCSGCKACVCACHSLNGLDEGETWRSVGLLISNPRDEVHGAHHPEPYQQHVTSACHHCVDPACANGCPVLAYEKDPETGIVRHLDDQCIGCQYCILKCPYDVPKYSKKKGIVRKCDMCHNRLSVGEAPACVQACPHEAIRIEVVDRSSIRLSGSQPEAELIPGAFSSRYTLPTTRYLSSNRVPATARPADQAVLRLETAHWPLVFMLILTQLAAGMHLVHASLAGVTPVTHKSAFVVAAAAILFLGLTLSVLHLGRPLKAWRAFLGWRKSWMSREIILFTLYAGTAGTLMVNPANLPLALMTAVAGLAAVGCSAMIYIDTRRPAWGSSVVFTRFVGTVLLLGVTGSGALAGWVNPTLAPQLAIAATLIRTALFLWDTRNLLSAIEDRHSALHRSALVALKFLRPILAARVGLFIASTWFSVMAVFNMAGQGAIWGLMALATTVTGQVLERYMFFVTCPAPKMPGAAA